MIFFFAMSAHGAAGSASAAGDLLDGIDQSRIIFIAPWGQAFRGRFSWTLCGHPNKAAVASGAPSNKLLGYLCFLVGAQGLEPWTR